MGTKAEKEADSIVDENFDEPFITRSEILNKLPEIVNDAVLAVVCSSDVVGVPYSVSRQVFL